MTSWDKVIARNEWFERKVCAYLARNSETLKAETLKSEPSQLSTLNPQPVLFSYSYAAREIFRFAKSRGWTTVLGQIDPGPFEEEIVAKEVARVPHLAPDWKRAPARYWDNWQEECSLADHIIVNSEWARTALIKSGVSGEKLSVIPLAYEGMALITDNRSPITRVYPDRFTPDRPLRVLFLGQVNPRKGVARLFEAIRLLAGEPIEFQFVGPVQVSIPDDIRAKPQVRWFGTVSRSQTADFYRDADVLIFPTLSDGFGLTQLEAQTWGLPVIASRYCGDVIRDGVNGIRLAALSGDSIADALRSCLWDPSRLRSFAEMIRLKEFGLDQLGKTLLELFDPTTNTVSA